jgi:hypothetical protein
MRLFDLFPTLLLEDLQAHKAQRGDFIVKTYANKWQGLPGFNSIEEFVEKLGEIDPTPKGIYMQWLAKLCIQDPERNRTEDLSRIGDDLKAFETFKSKLANKDINSYKSFDALYEAIAPFLAPKKKSKEELAADRAEKKLANIKGEITTVYTGPEGWIRIPTTKKAAQFLGQSTRWCTSASANNMFDHYNKRDSLFVIYNKADKTRHQLHIDSGQFADTSDKNKGINAVPQWARQPIVNWYKENNPQLSLKQLMSLSNFTDENLAAGSDHEDLLALMKQYGV